MLNRRLKPKKKFDAAIEEKNVFLSSVLTGFYRYYKAKRLGIIKAREREYFVESNFSQIDKRLSKYPTSVERAFELMLLQMNIPSRRIKVRYYPDKKIR